MLDVTLHDGEQLVARVGEGTDMAMERLEMLHSRLSTETFVVLGTDTIVRSEDVRFIQLRERDAGGDSGGGFLDSVKSTFKGDNRGMTQYETEQGGSTGAVGGRRVAGTAGRGSGGPGWADQYVGYGRRPWAETKPFFLTSEFLGALAMIAAVLIASAVDDALDAPRAWLLATIIASAYILSRGFAKSGTRDPNPDLRGGGGDY